MCHFRDESREHHAPDVSHHWSLRARGILRVRSGSSPRYRLVGTCGVVTLKGRDPGVNGHRHHRENPGCDTRRRARRSMPLAAPRSAVAGSLANTHVYVGRIELSGLKEDFLSTKGAVYPLTRSSAFHFTCSLRLTAARRSARHGEESGAVGLNKDDFRGLRDFRGLPDPNRTDNLLDIPRGLGC